MKKLMKTAQSGLYAAPQCKVLILEGGPLMDPGSSTLPIVVVTDEEDW